MDCKIKTTSFPMLWTRKEAILKTTTCITIMEQFRNLEQDCEYLHPTCQVPVILEGELLGKRLTLCLARMGLLT